MRSIKSYLNVNHGILDVMTYGARRVVRLSQTDVRQARHYFEANLPDRHNGRRLPKALLNAAVLNKASDALGLTPRHLLTWIERKFGRDVIADFAANELGMTKTNSVRKAA